MDEISAQHYLRVRFRPGWFQQFDLLWPEFIEYIEAVKLFLYTMDC